MEVYAIRVRRKTRKFDSFKTIVNSGFNFVDGDVVVVSSKFVSISEGLLMQLKKSKTYFDGKKVGEKVSNERRINGIV